MLAAIGQCRNQFPRARSEAFGAQVKMPLAVRKPELIAGGGRVGRGRVDRRIG